MLVRFVRRPVVSACLCTLLRCLLVVAVLSASASPARAELRSADAGEPSALAIVPQPATFRAVTGAADSGAGALRERFANVISGDIVTLDPVVFPPARPVTIGVTGGQLPDPDEGNVAVTGSTAGYEGSGTAGSSGAWAPPVGYPPIGPDITVTATHAAGSTSPFAPLIEPTVVAQQGGPIDAVAASGSHAFMGQGPWLVSLDVSNPASPTEIGRLTLPNQVSDIILAGTLAYVAAEWGGLNVVDVTDAAHPVVIGRDPGGLQAMALAGSYLYLASYDPGLRIMDIGDPANPKQVGFLAASNQADSIAVAGHYAYLVENNSLHVIDVADPVHPVEVTKYDVPGTVNRVSALGTYVYLACGDDGLRVISVADPAHPVQVSASPTPGSYALDVLARGNLAYVTGAGLHIMDISDPAHPTQVGGYGIQRMPSATWRVAVDGERAFIANDDNLTILAISAPAAPTLLGRLDTLLGVANDVVTVGNVAYVATGGHSGSLTTVDISDPTQPRRLGVADWNNSGYGSSLAVSGRYAYRVSRGWASLQILDISDPGNPVNKCVIQLSDEAQGIAIAGDQAVGLGLVYAYIAGGGRGLRVMDVSNPTTPAEIGFYDSPGRARDVAVRGSYAYLADGDAGLRVLDVTDPAQPVATGWLDTPGDAYGVTLAGNYAYVADRNSLRIVDISKPTAPVQAGFLDLPGGSVQRVRIEGRYAFIANGWSGVRIVDIGDPAHPYEVGGLGLPGEATGVSVMGNYAYVADHQAGLYVMRLGFAETSAFSGRVTDAGGAPLAGVAVSDGAGYTVFTDVKGNYALSGLPRGPYTVRASKVGYVFTPATRTVTLPPSATNQDFTGALDQYTVSGRVTGRTGAPLAGVTIAAGTGISVMTNASGEYVLSGLTTGTYTLTAALAGYTFSPAVRTIALPPVQVRQDFTTAVDLSLFSQYGGATYRIAVQGDLAFVNQGPRLVILNVADPAHPVRVGQTAPFGSIVADVAVSGNYAYLIVDGDLRVINIADPVHPSEVAFVDLSARFVTVVGNYAYISENGLRIFDVSNPAAPTEVGSYRAPGGTMEAAVVGDYAYLAEYMNGVRILNIADRSHPVEVGFAPLPRGVEDIVVAGRHAYVAVGRGGGMHILDVADPAHPIAVSAVSSPENDANLTIEGSTVYYGAREGGLRMINVADPARPTQVGVFDTVGNVNDVAVVNRGGRRYVYATDYGDGVRVIEVTTPATPTEVGAYSDGPGFPVGLDLAGSFVYVTNAVGGAGLQIVDVSDPAQPIQVGSLDTPGNANAVTVAGHYAYIADGGSGLRVIDVGNPARPQEIGVYDTPGSASDVGLAGSHAYVADGDKGLQIMSIADPMHPSVVGVLEDIGWAGRLAVSGSYVYLLADSNLLVVNTADPAHPALAGMLALPGQPQDLAVADGYAYVVAWQGGLYIVDLADPAQPRLISFYATPISASGVTVAGHYAYVADRATGLRVINVADPARPVEAGVYDTPGSAYASAIGCYQVFAADLAGGLVTLRSDVCPGDTERQATPLPKDQVVTDAVAAVGYRDFSLEVAAGESLLVVVTPTLQSDLIALYGKAGGLPTWSDYDVRSLGKGASGNYVLSITAAQAGTYFISIYGRSLTGATGGFQIIARTVTQALTAVQPRTAGNISGITLDILGLGFVEGMRVELRRAGTPTIAADAVTYVSATSLWAHFVLNGAATGVYDAHVIRPGGQEASLPAAFTITAGTGPRLESHLRGPDVYRAGRRYVLWLEYSNTGDTEMPAPLFTVSAPDSVLLRLSGEGSGGSRSVQVLGISSSGNPGRLPPGASERIPLYMQIPVTATTRLSFDYSALISDSRPFDWQALEASMRPAGMAADQWHLVCLELAREMGSTWGNYAARLRELARLLPDDYGYRYNIHDLFSLAVQQATARVVRSVSGTVVDDASGGPVHGDRIYLYDSTGIVTASAWVLNDGSFTLTNIEPGNYTVAFQTYVEPNDPTQISVPENGIQNAVIHVVRGGSLTGQVATDTGRGISGVSIIARDQRGKAHVGITDLNGSFSVGALATGVYSITLASELYVPPELAGIQINAAQQVRLPTITLLPGASISGSVSFAGNGPDSGSTYKVQVSAPLGSATSRDFAVGTSFVVGGLKAGQYEARISAPGYGARVVASIGLASGEAVQLGAIALDAGGGIQGIVTSSDSGDAIPQALIRMTGADNTVLTGASDGEGAFVIESLIPGTYALTINAPHFWPYTQTLSVPVGQSVPLSIALHPAGRVAGVVSGAGGGIGGITVQATAGGTRYYSAVTDATGHYSIEEMSPGSYRVGLAGGALSALAQTGAEISSTHSTVTVDFALGQVALISGRIYAADHQTPVAGALVALGQQARMIGLTQSAADGSYGFAVLADDLYDVEARTETAAFPAHTGVAVSGGAPLLNLDFVAGSQAMHGVVQDAATGQPISNAPVIVAASTGSGLFEQLRSTSTTETGAFDLSGLPAQTYKVTVRAPGYIAQTQAIVIGDGQTPPSALFTLSPGATLQGRVSAAETGNPVANALVLATSATDSSVSLSAPTNSDGQYEVLGLPGGTFTITVVDDIHQAGVAEITVSGLGTVSQDFSLSPGSTRVSGRVLDNAGTPVENAEITARTTSGQILGTALTLSDGTYVLETLPPGDYGLQARAFGYAPGHAASVIVVSGQVVSGIDFQITRAVLPVSSVGSIQGSNRTEGAVRQTPAYFSTQQGASNTQCGTLGGCDCSAEGQALTLAILKKVQIEYELQSLHYQYNAVLATAAQNFLNAVYQASKMTLLGLVISRSVPDALHFGTAAKFIYGEAWRVYNIFASGASPKSISNYLSGLTLDIVKLSREVLNLKEWKTGSDLVKNYLTAFWYALDILNSAVNELNNAMPDLDRLSAKIKDAEVRLNHAEWDQNDAEMRLHECLNNLNPNCCKNPAGCPPPPPPPPTCPGCYDPDPGLPIDPNEKEGPVGYGPDHIVEIGDELAYRIYFENIAAATAPAQEVFVTDMLDPSLDWGTFKLGDFAFGDQVIAAESDASQFHQRITVPDYRAGSEKQWWVDITAVLNYQTGEVKWTFRTLDPDTAELPEDALAGFLPPNDSSGRGEGHVSFSIKPKPGVTLGTRISNAASIVFDVNAPIMTNSVWNTVDRIGRRTYLPLIRKDSSRATSK